jgi:hypothetical protein
MRASTEKEREHLKECVEEIEYVFVRVEAIHIRIHKGIGPIRYHLQTTASESPMTDAKVEGALNS